MKKIYVLTLGVLIIVLGLLCIALYERVHTPPSVSTASVGTTSPNPTLLSPSTNLPAGVYTGNQTITLTAPPGATVHYFTGLTGTINCANGNTVSTSTTMTYGMNKILTAIACYPSGYSNTTKTKYILTLDPPIPSIPAGKYTTTQTLAFTSPYADSIRYTTDGTTPSCTQGTEYTTPLTISTSQTLKSVSCYFGTSSQILNLDYIISSTSTPVNPNKCDYALGLSSSGIKQSTFPVRCWDDKALSSVAANAGLEVIQNVPPPTKDNDPAYRFNPSTINTTQQIGSLINSPGTTVDGVKKYAYVWQNRCHPTPTTSSDCADTILKGNAVQTYPHNIGYEAFFTSRAKADVCTIAQAEGHAGATRTSILAELGSVGLSLADSESSLAAASQSLHTNAQKTTFVGGADAFTAYMRWPLNRERPWIADTCYIPEIATTQAPDTGSHIAGIVIDYEAADRRTPAQAIEFFQKYTTAVRAVNSNLKLILFNDDMKGSDTALSGLNEVSGPTAISVFDMVAIWAWPGPTCQYRAAPISTHLDAQLYELNGNRTTSANNRKVYMIYSLRNDEDIAPDARAYMLNNHLAGVMFFRDNSVQNSCDISKVTPARHIMDMLALPAPGTTPIVVTPTAGGDALGNSSPVSIEEDFGGNSFITEADTNPITAITPVSSEPTPAAAPQITSSSQKKFFDHDLLLGVGDGDVVRLQQFLNQHGYVVTASGPGSSGSENTYFGPLTQAALIRYQIAHQIVPSVGFFGPKTRQAVNAEL